MGYNLTGYTNLNKWFEKMQKLEGYAENEAGAKALSGLMKGVVGDETLY